MAFFKSNLINSSYRRQIGGLALADSSESLYPSIGERIMLARRRAGLSQTVVGRRLGVTPAAISDIERAVTRPNLDRLATIARAIGVPLSHIVVLPPQEPQP